MEPMESSGGSNRPVARQTAKRRIWSPREEAILIQALREIISDGWRCENGFRTGYLVQLEKIIRRYLPQTDLRAEPHIGNKMHVWKKNHGSIQTMLSRSGFAWSDKDNMVVFECNSIWDEYVKTDNHAKGMKNKSYPLYKEWCDIFGNDRATGEFAEDMHAAENNPVEPPPVGGQGADPVEGLVGDDDSTSAMEDSARSSGKQSKRQKRHRDTSAAEKMVSLVGTFVEETNLNLKTIASRSVYEMKMSEKRETLFATLGSLEVLSIDQQIQVAKLLAKDNRELELFFSLPKEAQARMVVMMVSGRL